MGFFRPVLHPTIWVICIFFIVNIPKGGTVLYK